MIRASSEPVVSSTKVERHTPDTRPSSEEAHLYRSPTDRGRETSLGETGNPPGHCSCSE